MKIFLIFSLTLVAAVPDRRWRRGRRSQQTAGASRSRDLQDPGPAASL